MKKGRLRKAALSTQLISLILPRTVVQADVEATTVGVEVRVEGSAQPRCLLGVEHVRDAGPQGQIVADIPAHRQVVAHEVARTQILDRLAVRIIYEIAIIHDVLRGLPVSNPRNGPVLV